MHEAAERLGVHYMTVYRYVRLGQLPARKVGTGWRIDAHDLERFGRESTPGEPTESGELVGRVELALVDGDEASAWLLLTDALRAGSSVEDLYLRVLRPALHDIGERWAAGELTVAQEHKASAVVTRLVGRLGHQFATPGRRRGMVVLGSPPGDHHALPAAMFADLLRGRGLAVVDLGSDVPAASFQRILRTSDGPVAVCVSATTGGNDDAVRALVHGLRDAFPQLLVAVGGSAVTDAEHARRLGSELWEPDPARAAACIADLLSRAGHRPRPG
jgi:MerR family transcriptional regulator, light-induced transcriptional regulator